MTEQTPATPPTVWWSPTLGVIEAAEAVLYIHGGDQEIPNLPADAVPLVPIRHSEEAIREAARDWFDPNDNLDLEEFEETAGDAVRFVLALLNSPGAAGAVPATGQARETIQRGRWTEERNALAGKLLDHLVDYEAALGRLPVDDVDGAMAVRLANVVLSAGWQPSGDTVQSPDAADLAYARSEVDKWLASADPYCILPTRTEHIPALLARLDELEGTR